MQQQQKQVKVKEFTIPKEKTQQYKKTPKQNKKPKTIHAVTFTLSLTKTNRYLN